MASEKDTLPPYTLSEPAERSSKKTILLATYGAAVTALLVAGVVFGTILYERQQPSCVPATTPPTSELTKLEVKESDGERQEIQRDFENEVELIEFLNNGSTNGTLLALDFRKSLTGVYVPSESACYLIGGIDVAVPSPFQNEDKQDVNRVRFTELRYKLASDYPILDRSIVPFGLHELCMGRQVYWLERLMESEVEKPSRPKRGRPFTISITICITCCPWKIRWGRCQMRPFPMETGGRIA